MAKKPRRTKHGSAADERLGNQREDEAPVPTEFWKGHVLHVRDRSDSAQTHLGHAVLCSGGTFYHQTPPDLFSIEIPGDLRGFSHAELSPGTEPAAASHIPKGISGIHTNRSRK